jgi:hypothetical protein
MQGALLHARSSSCSSSSCSRPVRHHAQAPAGSRAAGSSCQVLRRLRVPRAVSSRNQNAADLQLSPDALQRQSLASSPSKQQPEPEDDRELHR